MRIAATFSSFLATCRVGTLLPSQCVRGPKVGNLKEALQRVRQERFGAVPRVWQVGRCLVASSDEAATVEAMRAVVLDWGAGKWPGLIPKGAWRGEDFEVIQGGLNIAAANANEQEMWAFRSEHIDRDVARNWVTEVLAASLNGRRVLGIRNPRRCTCSRFFPGLQSGYGLGNRFHGHRCLGCLKRDSSVPRQRTCRIMSAARRLPVYARPMDAFLSAPLSRVRLVGRFLRQRSWWSGSP
jgi:hypothetical protein